MTGTVGSSAGTGSLGGIIRPLGLSTERTLIDAPLLGTRERQAHVLEFEHGLRTDRAHVLDSVLVTDVVGTLDGIVHVPAPIIVRISRSNGAGDATLGGHGVRAGRENLGDYGSLVTTLSQLQCGTHARTTATDDDGVIGKSTNASH